jgi:NAD(P)-dependent dehydrogenase (short-subunit alcohol dehydrogenase family)
MPDLTGRTVFITGITGALGRVLAGAFLAHGAAVAGTYRDAGRLDELRQALGSAASRVTLLRADLSDPTVWRGRESELADLAVDVLVNNAGLFRLAHGADADWALWHKLFAVNVTAAAHLAQHLMPAMGRRGFGRIVNISSIVSLAGAPGLGPFSASKAALNRLTEALAGEAPPGVTVNALLPGTLDTPRNRAAMPDADATGWVSPARVADVVLFLAGPAAAGLNGALIPVTEAHG